MNAYKVALLVACIGLFSLVLVSCITAMDEDGDGMAACVNLPGFVSGGMPACDPDDNNADVHNEAEELCDGVDNDLDGETDEGFDADGDGYFDGNIPACEVVYNGDADCDDSDPNNFPGNDEVCDGADNDCDGLDDFLGYEGSESDEDGDGQMVCAGDCNDADVTVYSGASELCDGADNDCNGDVPEIELDLDEDGEPGCSDCDDSDPNNFPDNDEVCDGADNDCDGLADAADVDTDADADSFSACGSEPDCDDSDGGVNPGAVELCDERDNNCDGQEDEGFDQDSDGFTSCGGDCNDLNSAFNPDAIELCDGSDNDCNGLADFDAVGEVDADSDGWLSCQDCDDADPNLEMDDLDGDGFPTCAGDCDDAADWNYPGNAEVCDGVDNDCDGLDDFLGYEGSESDEDGDGQSDCDGDCDDADAWNFLGNAEVCDGVDNDCDGSLSDEEIDNDLDGVTECDGDCDDANVTVFFGASELCDGADNDCDGSLFSDELDDDLDGVTECDGDCDDAADWNYPGNAEVCDGVDNDCDGLDDFLGYEGSESDEDGDGQSDCDGDCDDTDSFLNTLDEDGDGFDTCAGGDCDEDPIYGYLSKPDNVTEYISNWACADLFDNDCDGDMDFADEDCSPTCVPNTGGQNLVPDPGFDGPLQWVGLASNDPNGNTLNLESQGFATGQGQGLLVVNELLGAVETESVGVSFEAQAGVYAITFASRAAYATTLVQIGVWIRDLTAGTVVCDNFFHVDYAWRSYQFGGCCSLAGGTYRLEINYGVTPHDVELMFYGVTAYPGTE